MKEISSRETRSGITWVFPDQKRGLFEVMEDCLHCGAPDLRPCGILAKWRIMKCRGGLVRTFILAPSPPQVLEDTDFTLDKTELAIKTKHISLSLLSQGG